MRETKAKKAEPGTVLGALRPFLALATALDARNPVSARSALDKIGAAKEKLNELALALRALEVECEEQVARAMAEIEADLLDLGRRRGWRIEGGWPTYQIERGVELRVEPTAGIVRVTSKAYDATDLPAIEAAILERVVKLMPPDFAPRAFLEQIERAYHALSDRTPQVPIFDLYARLVADQQSARFWRDAVAERYVPLSQDQFRARLSAMLEAGMTTTSDGLELRLLPPLNPKDALFLYVPDEHRFAYVGRIEFVEVGRR